MRSSSWADIAPQTIWLFEDIFQAAYEVDLFGRVHRAIEVANANADSVAAARDASGWWWPRKPRAPTPRSVRSERSSRSRTIRSTSYPTRPISRCSAMRPERIPIRRRPRAGAGGAGPIEHSDRRPAASGALRADRASRPHSRQAPNDLEACVTPPRLVALIPVGDGSALIKRRPDVRQAERRLAAATAEIGVATADLYPTIRLVGLYGGAASN
jgi:hypothetical protein